MTELFRALVQRYKGLAPAALGKMTPYQVRQLYLESAEKDPDEVDGDEWVEKQALEKQGFLTRLAIKGVLGTAAEEKWADHLAQKLLEKPRVPIPDPSDAALD